VGKCGRCVRLTTLPPSCAVFMISGNLNFLEPSGPLQACNGKDLPFSGHEDRLGNFFLSKKINVAMFTEPCFCSVLPPEEEPSVDIL